MDKLHPYYRPSTLCEVCANFAGGCPWSESGNMRPVPGWDAIRRDLDNQAGPMVESYVVLRCPLFKLQERDRWAYERFDPEESRQKIRLQDLSRPGRSRCRKVRCLNTGVVYSSVKVAARSTGLRGSNIRAVLAGSVKHTRGTRWEYAEEEAE